MLILNLLIPIKPLQNMKQVYALCIIKHSMHHVILYSKAGVHACDCVCVA